MNYATDYSACHERGADQRAAIEDAVDTLYAQKVKDVDWCIERAAEALADLGPEHLAEYVAALVMPTRSGISPDAALARWLREATVERMDAWCRKELA